MMVFIMFFQFISKFIKVLGSIMMHYFVLHHKFLVNCQFPHVMLYAYFILILSMCSVCIKGSTWNLRWEWKNKLLLP